MDQLAEKLEIVQLLKDFLGVNEGLGGNAQVDVWYRALNCEIKEGDKDDLKNLGDLVKKSFIVCFKILFYNLVIIIMMC